MSKKSATSTQASAPSRTADYAIQGFLYQFNKTLLSIIESDDDAEIVVEGLIEDIDIHNPTHTTAIQCKYHEGQDKFQLSLLYRPILQMMKHFKNNPSSSIIYKIYCYFPDQKAGSKRSLDEKDARAILSSEDKGLRSLISEAKDIDLPNFITRFRIEFGVELDDLIAQVHIKFESHKFDTDEIPALIYPNAIHAIATLSIDHDEARRRVRKQEFLAGLRAAKKTVISRWTLLLKGKSHILKFKRSELKPHMAKNVRRRTFLISPDSLTDFDKDIILFISEFIDKYHSKPAHIETPNFFLDCDETTFSRLRRRIYEKGIPANDGLVGIEYVREHFTRAPVVTRYRDQVVRDFAIRVLRYEVDPLVLNTPRCDDLFIISSKKYPLLELTDVNEERFETENLQQAKYLLGMSDVYE